jgi:hypothetical protein
LGLLHSCTALTKLDVGEATLLDGDLDGLAAAAPTAVARLQHLELYGVKCAGTQALKQRLFPHLTSLTRLDVGGDYESELLTCFPPHISSMVSLQKVTLDEAGEA